MPPVVSLDSLCVPQPFRQLSCSKLPNHVFPFFGMAAAIAGGESGGAGGAGGSDPPQYPWRKDEVMDNLPPPPSQEEEEDMSQFSRRLCKKCGKNEYLRKGGCANPSCVPWFNNYFLFRAVL